MHPTNTKRFISFFTLIALGLIVSSCQKPAAYEDAAPSVMQNAKLKIDAPMGAESDQAGQGIAVAQVPQLAYSYTYGFSSNLKKIQAMAQLDRALCDKAGGAQLSISL